MNSSVAALARRNGPGSSKSCKASVNPLTESPGAIRLRRLAPMSYLILDLAERIRVHQLPLFTTGVIRLAVKQVKQITNIVAEHFEDTTDDFGCAVRDRLYLVIK
jgi:hypothetical protein